MDNSEIICNYFSIQFDFNIHQFEWSRFIKYESIYNFMEQKYNAFLVLLLIVSILIHSNIGIVSIIDDYIHDEKSKILIIMLKNFLLALLLIITILSISIIVF